MKNEILDLGATIEALPVVPSSEMGATSYANVGRGVMFGTTCSTINLVGASAPWVLEAAKKLEGLGRLRPGWDSYGGLPLNEKARTMTLCVLAWLVTDELPVPSVILGSAGTVNLEWHASNKELDVELGEGNSFEFVKVLPGGATEEGSASTNLPMRLRDLTQWLVRR